MPDTSPNRSKTDPATFEVVKNSLLKAAESLLDAYSHLQIVVIYTTVARIARYRAPVNSPRTSNGAANGCVGLILPTRRMDYKKLTKKLDLSGFDKDRAKDTPLASANANVVGAADAFVGGFAAAWCHGLSVEGALLWGYGAVLRACAAIGANQRQGPGTIQG